MRGRGWSCDFQLFISDYKETINKNKKFLDRKMWISLVITLGLCQLSHEGLTHLLAKKFIGAKLFKKMKVGEGNGNFGIHKLHVKIGNLVKVLSWSKTEVKSNIPLDSLFSSADFLLVKAFLQIFFII